MTIAIGDLVRAPGSVLKGRTWLVTDITLEKDGSVAHLSCLDAPAFRGVGHLVLEELVDRKGETIRGKGASAQMLLRAYGTLTMSPRHRALAKMPAEPTAEELQTLAELRADLTGEDAQLALLTLGAAVRIAEQQRGGLEKRQAAKRAARRKAAAGEVATR